MPSSTPQDELARWSRDGTALVFYEQTEIPATVDRIDVASGRRETIAELGEEDRAGLLSVISVSLADDLKTVAFVTWHYASTLYTVECAR